MGLLYLGQGFGSHAIVNTICDRELRVYLTISVVKSLHYRHFPLLFTFDRGFQLITKQVLYKQLNL